MMAPSQKWWQYALFRIRNPPNPHRIKSTIFEGILSSKLPDADKTDVRMAGEAQLVIFAGEGTTGSFTPHPFTFKATY